MWVALPETQARRCRVHKPAQAKPPLPLPPPGFAGFAHGTSPSLPRLRLRLARKRRGKERKVAQLAAAAPSRAATGCGRLRWGSGPESRLALAGRSLVWTAVWALGCYRNGERRCWRRDEPRVLTQQHRDGTVRRRRPVRSQ